MDEALLDDLIVTYMNNTGPRLYGVKLSTIKESASGPLGLVNWDQLWPILAKSGLIGAGGGGLVGLLRSLLSKKKQTAGDYIRNILYGGVAGGALGGGIGYLSSPKDVRSYEDERGEVQPGFNFLIPDSIPIGSDTEDRRAVSTMDLTKGVAVNAAQAGGLLELLHQLKKWRRGEFRPSVAPQASEFSKRLMEGTKDPGLQSAATNLAQRTGSNRPILPWNRGDYYTDLGAAARAAQPNLAAHEANLSNKTLGARHYRHNLLANMPNRPKWRSRGGRAATAVGIGALLTALTDRGEKRIRYAGNP